MKIRVDVEGNDPKSDYMEFDLNTMYVKTQLRGQINYEKFTHAHLAVVLKEFSDAFMKKGD